MLTRANIKTLLTVLVVLFMAYGYFTEQGNEVSAPNSTIRAPASTNRSAVDAVQAAYDRRQSDVQVEGSGTVQRLLSDDLQGSRHQRFILELDSGLTVLIAHNIDLAPRIDTLKAGDTVRYFGEYEWEEKGGVIHWTHHDPNGRHVDGWLKHDGVTYK